MTAYGVTDFPELSPDQWYDRVHRLDAAGLTTSYRGRYNRIMLSDADRRTFDEFRMIERNNPEAGLEWCIERLRYQHERTRAETLEGQVRRLSLHARGLTKALDRYKRRRGVVHRLRTLIDWITARRRPGSRG